MKFPLLKLELGSRLTKEDVDFLNELIPELFPERDLTDENAFTGREVIMAMAEASVLKLRKLGQSKPEDLNRIKELEKELKDSKQEAENELKAFFNKKNEEIDRLQGQINVLTEEIAGISTEHSQVNEKVLKLEKYAPVPNEMRIIIEPLTSRVLHLYAEKIRLRNKTEVTSGEILTSLFNRYVTKRETELPGFPFLVSKQEIINLANELNNE